MTYIFFSLFVFTVCVLLHVLLYRFLAARGIQTFKTIAVFALGFMVDAVLVIASFTANTASGQGAGISLMPLPLTSILLFAVLAALYVIFFTSPFLGDVSPSGKILFLIEEKGELSYKELQEHFTDEKLIIKRIHDLLQEGLIENKNNRYYATKRGERLARFLDKYRSLLHWGKGG